MRTVSGSRRGERIASTALRGDVRSSKVQKRRRVADRALRVGERDRVAQRRVGVAVAVRRPHAAAARPRSRDRRRRRVAGGVAVREGVPVRLGRALRSRPRALGAAAVRRAAALEGVAAACDRERPPEPPPPAARRAWLHCCDACDAGPNQECSVIPSSPPAFVGYWGSALRGPGPRGWRATPRVAFVLSRACGLRAPRAATARVRGRALEFAGPLERPPESFLLLSRAFSRSLRLQIFARPTRPPLRPQTTSRPSPVLGLNHLSDSVCRISD